MMQLIGMLDSPYVRRVAISFKCLGVSYEHKAISVFNTFEQFKSINPIVKAPTLICDDSEVLMDSSLILQYIEAKINKTLWSKEFSRFQHEIRIVGLALAACEKSVQLENESLIHSDVFDGPLNQAAITTAVSWQFTQSMLSKIILESNYPSLVRLSSKMEKLPEFLNYPPTGPGVNRTT